MEQEEKKGRSRPKTLEIKPPSVPIAPTITRRSSDRDSWRRTPVKRRKMTPEQRQAFVYGRHSIHGTRVKSEKDEKPPELTKTSAEKANLIEKSDSNEKSKKKKSIGSHGKSVDHRRSKSAASLFYSSIPVPTSTSMLTSPSSIFVRPYLLAISARLCTDKIQASFDSICYLCWL